MKSHFPSFHAGAVKAAEELGAEAIWKDPINMGYLGVKTRVAYLKGDKTDKRIDTGSTVATPDNMNAPAVGNRLNPDYKKWLKEN